MAAAGGVIRVVLVCEEQAERWPSLTAKQER
jgi:hypothetical protein